MMVFNYIYISFEMLDQKASKVLVVFSYNFKT